MSKFFQSKEFKKLNHQWNKKLKQKGFHDIEDEKQRFVDHGTLEDLKQRKNFKPGIFELNLEYYLWANSQLHTNKFKDEKHKVIWENHANGLSCAEISELINLDRTWISRLIKQIRKYLE
jgi:hypothetical protein